MAFFKNKYKMINASDDEIREFFAETIFEGIFSKEIKSSHSEYFKGHIHSIKINGVPNNVLGTYINVPMSANDIAEGPCTFKCRVKEEVRKSPAQINFSLSPKTLKEQEIISNTIESANTTDSIVANQQLDNQSVVIAPSLRFLHIRAQNTYCVILCFSATLEINPELQNLHNKGYYYNVFQLIRRCPPFSL